MLSNLISNAIKYTADGGVTICVTPITLADHGPGIKVEVIDTGTGVPLHLQHKLFNAFSQADETISRKFGGTGLGLSIVKSLALLMGGSVGMHSDAPSAPGSSFYFTIAVLPITAPPSKPPTPAISSCSQLLRPLHFLVVDDTPMNLKLMDRQLKVLGCTSTLVSSGQEVVQLLRQLKEAGTLPDVVLMDVWMPEMDGFQTTSTVRGFLPSLPILGLTADVQGVTHSLGKKAGMVEMHIKPLTRAALVDICNRFSPPSHLSTNAYSLAEPIFISP